MEQLGKYQLVRKIATGGMAEVWLAQADGPRGFSKQLVVKRILPHLAEEQSFLDMFLSEARLAAQLNHPNVVQIFDFGEAEGTWFIAMEFIDGPSLRSIAKRVQRTGEHLPLAAVARLVAGACEGLAYAHDLLDPQTGRPLGLVHRDISPDNILVSRNGAVKVVDFGIAKASGQAHHTKTGSVKGKLSYMPPEQLSAERLDRRTDIYALGVVLYELLAGAKPYAATSEAGLMKSILYEAPVPIREQFPEIPDALERIVERALAKDREERYATCAQMQEELERFIQSTGEIVGAPQLAALVAEWAPPQPPPGAGEPTPSRPDTSPARGPDVRRRASREAVTRGGDEEPLGGKTQTDTDAANARRRGPALAVGWAAGGVVLAALALVGWMKLRTPPEPAPLPDPPVAPIAAAPDPVPSPPPAVQLPELQVPAPPDPEVEAANTPSPPPPLPVAPPPVRPPRGSGATPAPVTAPPVVPAQRVAAAPPPAEAVPLPVPGPATVPAAAVQAQVEILSDPPTQVYVNGAFVSPSPARVTVPPGRVQVRLFDSVKGVDKGVVLELLPGDNGRKALSVAQRPVEFRVTPWATVFVDGKKLGDTPFDEPVSLYEGRHKVKLVNPELGVNRTLELEVGAGPNVVKARLDDG